MRRFELVEGTSSKFWEVEQDASDLNIRWGRIGTQGQSQTKSFADEAKAAAALTKLVNEKTGKGYTESGVEAGSAASPVTPAKAAKPAKATKAKAEAAQPDSTPDVPEFIEPVDEQATRGFESIRQAILVGSVKTGDVLSVAQLRRRAGVSEEAAKLVWSALATSGLINRWSSKLADKVRDVATSLPPDWLRAVPAAVGVPDSGESTLPPWLRQGEPLHITQQDRLTLYPSRRFAPTLLAADPASRWREIAIERNMTLDRTGSEPDLLLLAERVIERIKGPEPEPDRDADRLMLALALCSMGYYESVASHAITAWLIARYGLREVIEMYIDAQHLQIDRNYDPASKGHPVTFHRAVNHPFGRSWNGVHTEAEIVLRNHLAAAPAEEWEACADRIAAAVPHVPKCRRPAMAQMLPDRPDVAHQVLTDEAATPLPETAHWLLLIAEDPVAIAAALKVRIEGAGIWGDPRAVSTLLLNRGVRATPLLARHAEREPAGNGLTQVGTPEAVEALARVASSSKQALASLSLAVSRWPQAALVGLLRVVAPGGKDAGLLMPNVVQLLRSLADATDEVLPWLEPAERATLERQRAILKGPSEVAAANELPPVLAAPPWLAAKQKKAATAQQLQTLPLAPREAWDSGAREAALEETGWTARRLQQCRNDPAELVSQLGFHSSEDYLKPLTEQAVAAVQQRDSETLVRIWREMIVARRAQRYFWLTVRPDVITALPEGMAVPFWNAIADDIVSDSRISSDDISRMVALHALAVLPAVTAMVRNRPADCLPRALAIGAIELAPTAARAFARLKSVREVGRTWLLRHPEHAAVGLLPAALGKAGEARDSAASALRLLWLNGHEALLREVAGRYNDPAVLEGLERVMDENPLDRFPGKRTALPAFWNPTGWRRPVLHNGKALGDDALQALGQMLTFPTNEEIYAGIPQVAEACRADSLADFCWDLFGAWLNAGAPGKEGWALQALAHFGNDDTARRLTPFIRAWPGESAHARAVTGLDVLAAIGSDVALMQINGIAQKVKFKGLQDKAREKIAAIAEARQLSTEELEDRLAPDLGLDEHGTLRLDFGPRAFKVGFDEALKPYVREHTDGVDGARLPDLPKPKKTDDAALAEDAVERFKALKKDVRTIASQQVLRLELAMCARRRWTPELFRTFLVEHPLLRHLVQRLVWGVYAVEPGHQHGGVLQACFRVAEDGSFTTADDDSFALPEGEHLRIGVPHALELDAADAAAFGQLLADYELLQPFAQIGRDTYSLDASERAVTKLLRWKGAKVPTGRVLGLVNKGWRRGMAQDGGGIWYFTKPLGDGRVIELLLDPGIIVGMVNEYPEQELGDVQYGKAGSWGEMRDPDPLTGLDDIATSELIRDLEALRA